MQTVRVMLLGLMSVLSVGAQAADGDVLSRIKQRGELVMGVRNASVPFSMIAQNGGLAQGYSIDLCNIVVEAVRKQLNDPKLPVRQLVVTPSDRIERIKKGEVDIECGSTTHTHARAQDVRFSFTSFVTGVRLLVRANSGINSISDMRDKTLVLLGNSTSEKLGKKMGDTLAINIKYNMAKDAAAAFAALESKQGDAYLMDEVLLAGFVSNAANPADWAIVGKYLSIEPYAIMLPKGDEKYETLVDKALSDYYQSGQIFKLYESWFQSKKFTLPLNQYTRESFTKPNKFVLPF
jgi:glutamate/aspartate transport system substrate-binding protein